MSRRYLVVRTDKKSKSFILSELEQGRLRQGWGWKKEQDLRVVREKIASGVALTDDESAAWRNRRLLGSEPDGLKVGDVLVLPNLPEQGQWVLARVKGDYSFSPAVVDGREDFGHVVPVEPIRNRAGRIGVIAPDNEHVHARLRATMRSLSRMWGIDNLKPHVEDLVRAIEEDIDTRSPEGDAERFESFFDAMKAAAWRSISAKYHGAELEDLILRLFTSMYRDDGSVERTAGPSEKGADLVITKWDVALGLEFKIGVQIKLHDGVHDDPHALDQIRRARMERRVDAGVVVSTAESFSATFKQRRDHLQDELQMSVALIDRDALVRLMMRHLGETVEAP